jgi:hypothetical protein
LKRSIATEPVASHISRLYEQLCKLAGYQD